jgi:hypothetical protein
MKRAVSAILAAVLGLALFSGCAGSPSMAAKVGDRVITEDQLQRLTDGMNRINLALNPTSDTQTKAKTFQILVIGVICSNLRSSNDIMAKIVTDDEISTYLETEGFWQSIAGDPDTRDFATDLAAYMAVANKVNYAATEEDVADADAVAAAIKEYPVEVNPRYGSWDGATLTVVGSGSLSEPVSGA